MRTKILNKLTGANDLELCIYEAIHDVMSSTGNYECAQFAKYPFERKLKKLKDYQLRKELLALRLYRLANQVVAWQGNPYEFTEELDFLKEHIVEGYVWETFMAFSDAWPRNKSGNLENNLPLVHEIGEYGIDNLEDENSISNDEKTMPELELSSLKSEIGKIKFLICAVIALIIILLIYK